MEKVDFSAYVSGQQLSHGLETGLLERYIPSEDEQYMNEQQLAYFKEKLLRWRDMVLE